MRSRAFATFLVVWVVAIGAVLLAQIQGISYRQAASGREQMARVRAYWAARAGVESTIARLAYNTERPDETDAFRVVEDMEEVATGSLPGADWMIAHEIDGRVLPGPADAHARLNVAIMNTDALMLIPFMTEDVADSIQDWIDADDDQRPYGAEAPFYQRADFPYEPRNAPMRTITELELVAGTDPEIVRAEDWDLDGQLDPDENDGSFAWPPDNADHRLDPGWTEHLTASSWEGSTLGFSGEPVIDLTTAADTDLTSRLTIDADQATAIISLVQTLGVPLTNFLITPLSQLARTLPDADQNDLPEDLTTDQLALLFAETTDQPPQPTPGKLNLNTAADETLDYIPGISLAVADAIRFDRADRQNGYTSIVDLLDIPDMNAQTVAALMPYVTVRSNDYIVASRGRDRATGLEVQIVATIDRSSLPVSIREITIR